MDGLRGDQLAWGQLPPLQPQPPVGQADVPQEGEEYDVEEELGALKVDNCRASFLDPHCGQLGLRAAETNCSEVAPQAWQTYSYSGMVG